MCMKFKIKSKLKAIIACGSLMFGIAIVRANPTNGVVSEGQATITTTGDYTQINQTTDKAIINWDSFNIGSSEHTHFNQPSTSSTALNRIDASSGISEILGRLSATGHIYLINPAGFLFGANAMIDVAGLVATTANITDTNFLNENYTFEQSSLYPSSSIINYGAISAKDSGLVALVAPGVANYGQIVARAGRVLLGSASNYTLDMYGDDLIHFAISKETTYKPKDHTGNDMDSNIINEGEIYTDGGQLLIKASIAKGIVDNVINMQGVARANSISKVGGKIILNSGSGKVYVKKAKLEAKGNQDAKGGFIKIEGEDVVVSDSTIDVSGDVGGGLIQIGIDDLESETPILSDTTYIDKDSIIKANANRLGDGGKIYI